MKRIIFTLFIFPSILLGQNIDSLKLALKNSKHDTTRCNVLSILAETANDEEWPAFNEELKNIAEKNISNNATPRKVYLRHLAHALNNVGFLADNKGNIPMALDYFHQSLKILTELGYKQEMANSLNNIAAIYGEQGSFPKALEYFNRCFKITVEIGDKRGIAEALVNMGAIYQDQGNIPKSLEYYQKGLKIQEEIGYKEGIANSLNNIGTIYSKQENSQNALEYFQKSLKIQEEIGDKHGIANSLTNIANLLTEKDKLPEALSYANRSMRTAMELGYPIAIKRSANCLKSIFKKQNKLKEAFEMYELEIKMKDSINNEETQKAAVKKQIQYTYETKEAVTQAGHKKELEKQQAVADEKERKQFIVIWSIVVGLILVIGFAGYVFKTLRITRKQKSLIETKSKEVEEKQREILDSIHYAKRIQTAQLPSDKYINKNLCRLQNKG